MTKSVYIHIPFCKQKCKYCSFISFPKIEYKTQYIECLKKEISYKYNQEPLNTLYFGGGTPSLLSCNEFESLIKLFVTNENTEITTELNPENLDYEYLSKLKDIGINRISIGCQTFDDKILGYIGRKHTGNQVIKSVLTAQKVGFNNISLDFIYGLPNQSIENFSQDLICAIDSGIQHISLYGLKIDEGCYFNTHYPDNLPDEDCQADMYLKAIDILSSNNFIHYEISNFAKKGFESKHNLNYWKNNSYYGFGVAAHGYIDGIRYSNRITLEDYCNNCLYPLETKQLSIQDKLEEEIFLGFRCMCGVNIELINEKYGIDFEQKYHQIIKKYLSTNHIIKTQNGYKLSDNGILISNYILADFLE